MLVTNIKIKRIYDKPNAADGYRILVDRLWPRGISKEFAHLDCWLKSIAPSSELRIWYGHDPKKWLEFKNQYFAELALNVDSVQELVEYLHKGKIALLYAAKEPIYNHAEALKAYISSL